MNVNLNSFMQLMQSRAMRDPQVKNALQMLQGKSSQELQQMALNMCKERGTTPEQILRNLGF